MRATAEPITLDLHFEAMDLCDGCGRPLAKSEQFVGLCRQCNPPERKVVTNQQEVKRRK
jgi:predicted amidophosphoribosyltransferase